MRMLLARWDDLPDDLRIPEVEPYWQTLDERRGALAAKRAFDVVVSATALVVLSPVLAGVALAIRRDSPGPALYRQERVTQYGKVFRIHKFRTMSVGADAAGGHLTTAGDARITRVGERLRRYHIDELPQLVDVLRGDMSLVGTRPEVPEYVACYLPAWRATLLLPAGVTSEASVEFRDEAALLGGDDAGTRVESGMDVAGVATSRATVEDTYLSGILPRKMELNLRAIRDFGLARELGVLLRTLALPWARGGRDDG